MEMVMKYLANPYIQAALIGGGAYIAMEVAAPKFVEDIPMVTSANIAILAAVSYIAYLYYARKISLPVLGMRAYKPLSVAVSAPPSEIAQMRAMTMNDLYKPDQY